MDRPTYGTPPPARQHAPGQAPTAPAMRTITLPMELFLAPADDVAGAEDWATARGDGFTVDVRRTPDASVHMVVWLDGPDGTPEGGTRQDVMLTMRALVDTVLDAVTAGRDAAEASAEAAEAASAEADGVQR